MTYRERREARADRLRGWAETREQKSAAGFEHARKIADGIPLGQPILVGHHSESHHRRDIARIDGGMRAGIEHAAKAREMASKADEIERQAENAIYSDDPDAIERLTEKIAGLEAERERQKALNVAYRNAHRAELKAEPSAYQRSIMVPFPAYSLQNLGGNITRCRQRLAFLSGPAQPATSDGPALTVTSGMTTPSRPGKQPRQVWTVTGDFARYRQDLINLGGSWYRGAFSFWDDPTEEIEQLTGKDRG